MKTKILALLVTAMIIFNVSYANDADNNVNGAVLTSFTQQFENASGVEWSKMDGYYKASFTWNDQYLIAFYDNNGESIAIARNVKQKDMPVMLQSSLAEGFKDYWISDLFEYTTKDSNKYYVTVENADKKIVLESMDNNYWEVLKKTSKD